MPHRRTVRYAPPAEQAGSATDALLSPIDQTEAVTSRRLTRFT
jgi:hypothetical protein